MRGPWFSFNGTLRPVAEAAVSLDDLAVTYGSGVYETLKVRRGLVYFAERHEERLFHSAAMLGLAHPFKAGQVQTFLWDLAAGNALDDANLKVLLYGDRHPERARLYVLALNPLFPDRKNYSRGGRAVTYAGERLWPQAKSLNMLLSALAYGQAQDSGAYDALLVNRQGEVTEGTRTNLFVTDGQTVIGPPAAQILEGVTKLTLLECLAEEGIPYREQPLPLAELSSWAGVFLTSTSTKVMPLAAIDGLSFEIPPLLVRVREAYDRWLARYAETLRSHHSTGDPPFETK